MGRHRSRRTLSELTVPDGKVDRAWPSKDQKLQAATQPTGTGQPGRRTAKPHAVPKAEGDDCRVAQDDGNASQPLMVWSIGTSVGCQ